MPLAVTCSASIDWTTTRSPKGCKLMHFPHWHSMTVSAKGNHPRPRESRREAVTDRGHLSEGNSMTSEKWITETASSRATSRE